MARCTRYDQEYEWVDANGIDRAHWHPITGVHVDVFPPSEGEPDWMVIVSTEKRDEKIKMRIDEDTAFHYAAKVLKVQAN